MYRDLFPDHEHPLFTPDAALQEQIAERVKQAKKGPQTHRKRDGSPSGVTPRRGVPMGKHPQISNEVLGRAWGVSRNTARELVNHPEKMSRYQVHELCEWCGVTPEWLAGLEDKNTYGERTHGAAGFVSDLYDTLRDEDKALIYQLLVRLAGPEAYESVKAESWSRQMRDWYEHHPDEAEAAREQVESAAAVADAYGLRGAPDVEAFLRSVPQEGRPL